MTLELDGSRASSRWISAMSAMPATPPAAPAIAERITMPREDRIRNRMRFIEAGSFPLVLFEAFDLTRQDFGEPLDRGPLQDRVVVARNEIGCDAPDRQVLPAPRRVTLKVAPARFRPNQDDASGVGARLIAIQGQAVRPIDVVQSPEAFGADLAGDLATEARLLESPVSDRFGIETAEALEERPGRPPRCAGQVGHEGHQALTVINGMRRMARNRRRAIDQEDQRDLASRGGELPGHLECHDAPHRPPAQEVGAFGVLRQNRVDVS